MTAKLRLFSFAAKDLSPRFFSRCRGMRLLPMRQRLTRAIVREVGPLQRRTHWQWREIGGLRPNATMEQQDYSKWNTDDLIKRVTSLEQQLKEQTTEWANAELLWLTRVKLIV